LLAEMEVAANFIPETRQRLIIDPSRGPLFHRP
jgi:hypothetical protein